VRIDERVLAGAVELIAHDLTATLGWDHARAQAKARDALDNRMQAVEDLQQRLHDTFVTPPGRRARTTGSIRCGLGNTTVAGPRGAARAMMRRSARWGTAGAAG